MTTIAANLQAVRARIRAAAAAAGRDPDGIGLLAVSKTWPASCVREAAAAGQTAFGENYAQEGAAKVVEIADPTLEWHFIGPLQSNKTRLVAESFDWVHSIEREKIARRLSDQRDPHLPALKVCIQVNVSGEQSKSGVAPQDVLPLARAVVQLPRIELRGLMCIPEPTPDKALLHARFATLRGLRDTLAEEGIVLDTLSMGMSDDLEAAIAAGSTLVRVGSAIFGARNHSSTATE